MSQLTDLKRKRKIRRIVGFSIAGVILLAGLIYWITREEEPPSVRTASLSYGNIRSVMMLSAEIYPGSIIRQTAPQSQRVESVAIAVGDQVRTGDVLLTLDRSELLDQFEQAVEAREQIEQSITESEAAAQEQANVAASQAQASQQALQSLEGQISQISVRLSGALAQLARVSSLQPVLLEVNPDLSNQLALSLTDFDPEREGSAQQLQNAIDLLIAGVGYSENPEYQVALAAIQSDLLSISNLLPQLTGSLTNDALLSGLTSGLTSGLSLPDDLAGQLGNLGNTMQNSLNQARQLEEQAKERYDQSVSRLIADSDGVVAQVNVKPGDYIGPAVAGSTVPGLDLGSLLGGGVSLENVTGSAGGTTAGSAAVVIYDNTRPLAVFKASQFDIGRLEIGMPVRYQYDDRSFSGEISFIAPFASTGSFQSGTGSGLPTDLGAIGGLASDPWLEVQMSIFGTDLTDLIPGFNIDAEIETATAENVLILPAEAMRRELDEYFVYVLDADNRLVRRSFTPGIQSDMSVEVIEGLSEEDTVVLNPTSQLQDGLQVQVNNDA